MDSALVRRENRRMLPPGGSRRRIARVLKAAYAGGLLSDETFARRTDQVLRSRLIDPVAVVGDLNLRRTVGLSAGLRGLIQAAVARLRKDSYELVEPILLALDWNGAQGELLLGRHHACDVVLPNVTVSRRHARLTYRDEKWIVQDLRSTNGTQVNGTRVGRSELRPGDYLVLGEECLKID
jgi:FHA domain